MKKIVLTLITSFTLTTAIYSQYREHNRSHQRFIYHREVDSINQVRDSAAFPMIITPQDNPWQIYMYNNVPHYRNNYFLYSQNYWWIYYMKKYTKKE